MDNEFGKQACDAVWLGCAKKRQQKAGVVPFIWSRGHCIPLWVVLPSLQVVLSFACSVASLSRFPSHYLPCQLRLPQAATADYLFDKGQPIHAVCRTYTRPCHSVSQTSVQSTERHCPLRMAVTKCSFCVLFKTHAICRSRQREHYKLYSVFE